MKNAVVTILTLSLAGCAGQGPTTGEDTSAAAALSGASEPVPAACRGLSGLAMSGYYGNQPNVGRELLASVDALYVSGSEVAIPGVLKTRWSRSPYDYAAVVETTTWALVSVNEGRLSLALRGYQGNPDPTSFEAAKTLFEAMTNATETLENGWLKRASDQGSVVCMKITGGPLIPNGDSYSCTLGPLDSVSQATSCP